MEGSQYAAHAAHAVDPSVLDAGPTPPFWMPALTPPFWMDDAVVAAQWARELASPTADSAFLVADDALGRPVAFVWLKTERDYFIDMPVGRVERLPVAHAGRVREAMTPE